LTRSWWGYTRITSTSTARTSIKSSTATATATAYLKSLFRLICGTSTATATATRKSSIVSNSRWTIYKNSGTACLPGLSSTGAGNNTSASTITASTLDNALVDNSNGICWAKRRRD
jgi:hypothetical protein